MCMISQETQFLVSDSCGLDSIKIQYLRRTLGNVRSSEMQQEAVVSDVPL